MKTNSKYVKIEKKWPWSKPETWIEDPVHGGEYRVTYIGRIFAHAKGFPQHEKMTDQQVIDLFEDRDPNTKQRQATLNTQ